MKDGVAKAAANPVEANPGKAAFFFFDEALSILFKIGVPEETPAM